MAWWLKFGGIDRLKGAILGVSAEISQISDAPELVGFASIRPMTVAIFTAIFRKKCFSKGRLTCTGLHPLFANPAAVEETGTKLFCLVSIGDLVKSIIADQEFTIEQLIHYIQG